MTVFGPAWDQLQLSDLETFLQDAPAEPLEWEGKGGDWNPGSIRAAVCGFGNGHDVGYLILGADKPKDKPWSLVGIVFPNQDPPNAVTDVLMSPRGVRPYPDGLDVRAFDIGNGRHVAVVRVPPVATPPCMTYGTAYERVSGKTIPVTDPARLAELYTRGDAARGGAEQKAERAAEMVLALAPARPEDIQLRWMPVSSGRL